MNGLQATKRIRAFVADLVDQSPAQSCIRPYICLLTQNNTEQCKKKALDYGCDEVIVKPIFKAGVQRLLVNAGLIQNWDLYKRLHKVGLD